MQASKKIVIWGNEDLLSSSVELLLAGREEWEVVSLLHEEGPNAFLLAVEAVQPDIVIIHPGCRQDPIELLLQLLQDHPAIRVILINLENNFLEIYSKQNLLVKETSDLISVIEIEP
jgi:DNA-binding NarL/FixJ family response regulator